MRKEFEFGAGNGPQGSLSWCVRAAPSPLATPLPAGQASHFTLAPEFLIDTTCRLETGLSPIAATPRCVLIDSRFQPYRLRDRRRTGDGIAKQETPAAAKTGQKRREI